jgi:hypothetical protein
MAVFINTKSIFQTTVMDSTGFEWLTLFTEPERIPHPCTSLFQLSGLARGHKMN